MEPIPYFGRQLKRLREQAGLSQQELANQAGVSISVVSQTEQGQRADPRFSTAAALAHALGVSVAEFVADTPPAAPSSPRRRTKGK